jgi:predicted nucleotidyltransferase
LRQGSHRKRLEFVLAIFKRQAYIIRELIMKRIEEVKAKLESLKPLLKERYQVETIGFFGSFARGEQTKKSDIDILVEFSQPNTIDLFDFIDLEEFLSKKIGLKVDLVTKNALKPLIKDQILKETIYA